MTIAEAKHALITTAKNEIGYSEGDNNWNKYAVNMTKYYGLNVQNQPYCDIFTDWTFITTFGGEAAAKMTYQSIGSFSARCLISAEYFQRNNAWYKTPELGDVVFFYYNGDINHQGIVVEISGGVIRTVEGNSSDMVRSNSYAVGAAVIAGYGRPNWSIVASNSSIPATIGENPTPSAPAAPAENTCKVEMTLPILQKGDRDKKGSSWVKIMQTRLLDLGYSLPLWGADGDFGMETLNAVKTAQKDHGLAVDGVAGPATWKKLLEA